ncbi:MAG: hypothetical protein JO161_07640, partial [Planctomycetaceae bacterium]|nr:hypothetical protein [Planctomycetaceae bacterium]
MPTSVMPKGVEQNGPRPDASDRKDLETASAEWLLQNDDSSRPAAPKPVLPPGAGEEFELADVPSDRSEAVRSAGWTDPDSPRSGPYQSRPQVGRGALARPVVQETWSRAAEWRQTLLVLAAWAFTMFGLLFFAARGELFGMTVLVLLLGFVGGMILSYPLFITLERPVRLTPEQAARDYFGALSHRFPHYRRMWLLLSTRGCTSEHFSSFEEFKAYWMRVVDRLRQTYTSRFTSLVFKVMEFQGEKSAGRSEMDARFKLKVLVSEGEEERPVLTIALQRSFVRGP